jgi:hypothetical protein
MDVELVRAAEAARRLEIPTKEVIRPMYHRDIRFVVVDAIAHIPADAIDEYRSNSS